MKNIIIGIDGGGTATKIAALDCAGRLVAQSETESMNYNFMPMGECVSNVCAGINKLSLGGGYRVTACAIGDPSVDDEVAYELSERFINELRNRAGFSRDTKILLKSDVFMALYGLTEGKPGVLIISGTGSMGMAIDKKGAAVTVGGWGNPATDKGSGYDIAVKALSAVFDASDKTGPATVLTKEFINFYRVDKPRELIGILNGGNCKRADIAALAAIVSGCAGAGDETACAIINGAADDLAGYALSLLRRIDFGGCRVGMYGGVFFNNKVIQTRFKEAVLRHFPDAVVGFPEIPPEIAAARYAINIFKL